VENIRAAIAYSLIEWVDNSVQKMESTWGVRLIKEFFLLNEFIHTNEGKPREIAQVADVTQIIVNDYRYD